MSHAPLFIVYGLEANLVHSNNSAQKESVYRDYKLYYTQELAELVYQRWLSGVVPNLLCNLWFFELMFTGEVSLLSSNNYHKMSV